MNASSSFDRMYRLIHYRTRRLGVMNGVVWVRQEGGVLGVQHAPQSVPA